MADFEDAELRINKLKYLTKDKSAFLDEKTLDFLFLQGSLYRLKGDFQKAFEAFSDVIERSRQINDHERTLKANLALAEVIIDPYLINQDQDSRSNIDMAVNLIKDFMMTGVNVSPGLQIESQCLLGIIHTIKGELTEAQNSLDKATALLKQNHNKLVQIKLLFAQSMLKAALNRVDAALKDLDAGIGDRFGLSGNTIFAGTASKRRIASAKVGLDISTGSGSQSWSTGPTKRFWR